MINVKTVAERRENMLWFRAPEKVYFKKGSTPVALDELGTLTAAFGTPGDVYASFVLFLVPFLIAGYDVLQKAFSNIRRGKAFDESFLMAVATIGAFAMVLFPDTDPHMDEGASV